MNAQAQEIILSGRARKAFDLADEDRNWLRPMALDGENKPCLRVVSSKQA